MRFIHGYVRFFRCGSKKKKSANIDTTVVIFGPDIVPGSAGIQDPHYQFRLVFVDGKWIAYSCDAEPPIEDNEDLRVSFRAAGYFGDYSDQKFNESCDLGSLGAELQAFVDSYKLEFWESPWVKLKKQAEEEIDRWSE